MSTAKHPGGRKPLDPTDPSVSVTFRLPSKQYRALCACAKDADLAVPDLIRRAILRLEKNLKPVT